MSIRDHLLTVTDRSRKRNFIEAAWYPRHTFAYQTYTMRGRAFEALHLALGGKRLTS